MPSQCPIPFRMGNLLNVLSQHWPFSCEESVLGSEKVLFLSLGKYRDVVFVDSKQLSSSFSKRNSSTYLEGMFLLIFQLTEDYVWSTAISTIIISTGSSPYLSGLTRWREKTDALISSSFFVKRKEEFQPEEYLERTNVNYLPEFWF